MSENFERGPIQTYEVVWQTGHVERIQAHQVTFPMADLGFFGAPQPGPRRVMFHGEIDGHWMLILAAPEDDIRSIRNVSTTEAELT